MTNLSQQTALATLKIIEHFLPADFDQLGITSEEFEQLASDKAWRRDHIQRVMRTMNALIFGSMEVMALPKLIVPAEYVSAVICAVVHPANIMTCCVIMAQERTVGPGAMELAARGASPTQIDPCGADQLFSLCCILFDTEHANFARVRLREKLGLRIENSLKGLP